MCRMLSAVTAMLLGKASPTERQKLPVSTATR